MTPTFQLAGLDHRIFEPLFALSDEGLQAHGAVRRTATENPGFPCRVSLEDAGVGDELLLLPYLHQPAASPYRASGPIFVRRGATQRRWPAGAVPGSVARRLISVRAYDAAHTVVAADVCAGLHVAAQIDRFFSEPTSGS